MAKGERAQSVDCRSLVRLLESDQTHGQETGKRPSFTGFAKIQFRGARPVAGIGQSRLTCKVTVTSTAVIKDSEIPVSWRGS